MPEGERNQAAHPGPVWRRRLAIGARLAAAYALLALCFSLPMRAERVRCRITVPRTPHPRSGAREYPFALPRFQREMSVRIAADKDVRGLQVALVDAAGKKRLQLPTGPGTHTFTFSIGAGFAPGRYRFRVVENGNAAAYRVSLLDKRPLTSSQKLWGFSAIGLVLSLLALAWARASARRGRPRPGLRQTAWMLGALCLALAAGGVATGVHEGGHALAMSAFGVYDPANSDLFGVRGGPHASPVPTPITSDEIATWQNSLIHIAGPAFGTLLGWLSFLLWRARWGKRWREGRRPLDIIWSGFTALLLVGHFGILLVMTAGGMRDTDYLVFISGIGRWRLLGQALIVVVAIINAALIWVVASHLVRRRRSPLITSPTQAPSQTTPPSAPA